MMPSMEDYLRQCERELEHLREQRTQFEGGRTILKEIGANGQWVDTTQHWHDHIKKTISIYEGILARHRNKE
jgi:hypothetical protein